MAPEILYGKTGHNQQADIWSLGVLLYVYTFVSRKVLHLNFVVRSYTMLIGTPPFHESSHDAIYQ